MLDVTLVRLMQDLKAYWISEGIQVNPGINEDDISEFEGHRRICLPTDFRIYLTVVNGMARGAWDKHVYCFLSLQGLEFLHEGYVTFAHWSVYAVTYEMKLQNSPDTGFPVVKFDGEGVVSSSFADFVEKYLAEAIYD